MAWTTKERYTHFPIVCGISIHILVGTYNVFTKRYGDTNIYDLQWSN
jgi:hypothetical protein